ncbi:hypothetical protein PISMIDRAFT_89232, partial [Pisolithus microcarpus 441]
SQGAGNASLHLSASPCPSKLNADDHWTADTGATSHMTPHCHWLRNYTPKCVPICLADNTIVYSAGIGSVVFHPVIEGKGVRAVKFRCVLHVPDLKSNLLSVLYLTHHSGFVVNINSVHMAFSHPPGLSRSCL